MIKESKMNKLLPFKLFAENDPGNVTGFTVVVKDTGKVIGRDALVKDSDFRNCPTVKPFNTVLKTGLFVS